MNKQDNGIIPSNRLYFGPALGEQRAHPAPAATSATPAPAVPGDGWMPIETAPKVKGEYFWCWLAWGPEEDRCTGSGLRWRGKWFAASTFYHLGKERGFQFREHEVQPTHWQPLPAAPAATKEA